MKKIIKRILILILLIILFAISILIYKGYTIYKEALNEISIANKVKQIKSKENYTKIEDMPEIYLDAVIAVEDHRFFTHNGIDIISIVRASLNDIKAMSFVEGGSTNSTTC